MHYYQIFGKGRARTMRTLTLMNRRCNNDTTIENEFIDQYMPKANGEYVKVYLLLLRHLNNPDCALSISMLADCLDYTENDVLRALKYWEKQELLTLGYDETGKVSVIELGTSSSFARRESAVKPAAPKPMPKESPKKPPASSTSKKELKQLLFVAEQYLGKVLTKTDVDIISYFYEELSFSVDLIEYLIEYCVDNGHKSIHYIQKVGLAWADEHISTVEAARTHASHYNKNCYTIMNTFGIKGRGPALAELDYIRRWTEDYGFSLDIITEACNRTITNIHQPSFEYTDKILINWKNAGVHRVSDIGKADAGFQKDTKPMRRTAKTVTSTKFNNFQGRSYDMDSLEKQLLNSN